VELALPEPEEDEGEDDQPRDMEPDLDAKERANAE
jgi:hypothetical protein